MKVHVKLDLSDEQRNTLYRNISGKDVKRMISRKEVVELVEDHINELLAAGPVKADPEPALDIEVTEGHVDCCRANELLRRRLNKLQHRIDTGGQS